MRWSCIPISLTIFQFVVIHTVKDFSIVSEEKVDIFLEISCFFYDPTTCWQLDLCFLCLSKPSLYIWKFSFQVLLKPSLNISCITVFYQNQRHLFTSMLHPVTSLPRIPQPSAPSRVCYGSTVPSPHPHLAPLVSSTFFNTGPF